MDRNDRSGAIRICGLNRALAGSQLGGVLPPGHQRGRRKGPATALNDPWTSTRPAAILIPVLWGSDNGSIATALRAPSRRTSPKRVWLLARQMSIIGRRAAVRRLGWDKTVYLHHRTEEYAAYWKDAADALGASFSTLAPGYWEIGRAGRHTRINLSVMQFNDQVVSSLCADKALTYRLANELGLRVPDHEAITIDGVSQVQKRFGWDQPLVVKPANNTSAGIGVTTFVRTRSDLKRASLLASFFSPSFLVERMVVGESCRLLLLDGELVHAVRRRGLRVIGDGVRDVQRLAADAGHPLDSIGLWTLAAQGLDSRFVPAAGSEVLARSLPPDTTRLRELRTEYTEDITAMVGAQLIRDARALATRLEARLAGIDVVTLDPHLPLEATNGALLEVNPQPAIHHHYLAAQPNPAVATRLLGALI